MAGTIATQGDGRPPMGGFEADLAVRETGPGGGAEPAPPTTRVPGSRVTADLARSAWLMAYARGLAASPACGDDAPNELLRAADHDAELLRATRRRMRNEAARDLVTEALRRLEDASTGVDLEATRELLLAQAELFENPGDYAAGVRDAFEALLPLLATRTASVPEVIDLTAEAARPVDQRGEASSQ